MKGLFIRLDSDLEQKFSELCEQEGYKKTGLLTKWIRSFVAEHGGLDPLVEAEAQGIDLGKLRQNLHKSPTERLRAHGEAAHFAVRVRAAKQDSAA